MSQVADNELIQSLIDSEDEEFFDLLIRKAEEKNKSKEKEARAAVNKKKDEVFMDVIEQYCQVNYDGKDTAAGVARSIAIEACELIRDWRDNPGQYKLWLSVKNKVGSICENDENDFEALVSKAGDLISDLLGL